MNKTGYICLIMITLGMFSMPGIAEETPELTYDDILKMDHLSHFSILPDETGIVYMKSTGTDLSPPENNGTLILLDTKDGAEKTITISSESVISWILSPSGKTVAYVSMDKDSKEKSLVTLDISTCERKVIPDAPDELLSGFKWLSADTLLFPGADPRIEKEELPGDVTILDEIPDPVILKAFSIADGTVDLLTDNTDVIYQYQPSPDGRYILYKASTYPETWLDTPTFRYAMIHTDTGTEDAMMVMTEGFEDENQFVWEPDSSKVYIERMQNGGLHYPVRYTSDIITYTPETKQFDEVPLQWERKLLKDLFNDDVEITPYDGGVYVLLADGTNPKLAKYTKTGSGWSMSLLSGEHQGNIYALETNKDGSVLYYNYNTASVPPQIYRADVAGDVIKNVTQLTHLNQDLLEKSLGSSEVIEWIGADGDTIQGILRYPPGYTPDKQYPLVFVIHGGPTYTDFDGWRDTWEFPYHLITNLGVITLSTNYHGSSNFGFEFTESIQGGNYYDLPVEDFKKGADLLARKGLIDPDRTATTGWSNGGILSLAFVVRDQGLKAAVVGAGTADENSQDAYTNGIIMNQMYYEHTPYADPESYIPIVGVYRADEVRTPVLMLQGTEDQAVVPASAMATYRAYKAESQSDVKMILFKDEPHHLGHYENQLRKVMEETNWLAKVLA